MTNTELIPELQDLIDARLDAIDAVLIRALGSYSERRSIVVEVETQIFELLSRRGDNPTRENVVAVLDSLDPPESYIPEEFQTGIRPHPGQGGQAPAPRSKLPLLLAGIGLALVIDLVAADIGLAGRDLFQSENAREVLVGTTIVLTALFAATAMVWIKRSRKPRLDASYLRIAAILPLLLVDYLLAVGFSHARGNLFLCLTLAGAFLVMNLLAIRQFWRWIPIK